MPISLNLIDSGDNGAPMEMQEPLPGGEQASKDYEQQYSNYLP